VREKRGAAFIGRILSDLADGEVDSVVAGRKGSWLVYLLEQSAYVLCAGALAELVFLREFERARNVAIIGLASAGFAVLARFAIAVGRVNARKRRRELSSDL
jgi:hypothetical protein